MRKLIGTVVILAVLYGGVYAGLSWFGSYVAWPDTRHHWQPLGVSYRFEKRVIVVPGATIDQTVEPNLVGYIFLPLLLLDRAVWHRDTMPGY